MKNAIIVGYSTNRDEKAQKRFNKEIKKSIGCTHEIIPFQNNGEYSLTKTYNLIWQSVKDCQPIDNLIFVFIHHDIHFKCNGWGKNLLNIFNNEENEVDIVGLAGTEDLYSHGVWWLNENQEFNKKTLWGKVWHTDGKKEWKSDFSVGKKVNKLQPVVAIDGVFIAFNPSTCHKFDEDFDNFHYYDISFCMDNYLFGKNIAVTETIQIVHESGGVLSNKWEENRNKFCTIYESDLPIKI